MVGYTLHCRVNGSVVSIPSGVRGGAPAENKTTLVLSKRDRTPLVVDNFTRFQGDREHVTR